MSTAGLELTANEEPGQPLLRQNSPDPCALVIFGGSGDLTHRKLIPALHSLLQERSLPHGFAIIGFGRSIGSPEAWLQELLQKLSARHPGGFAPDDAWRALAGRILTVQGDYDDLAAYRRIADRLREAHDRFGTEDNRLFYMATPAETFPTILARLKEAGLIYDGRTPDRTPWSRVIIEKPFGRDLNSARDLNRLVGRTLTESQTFRIDHYLGKETVQNIVVMRFGNSIFEPLWNRKYIERVEITAAETLGVGQRGSFYDQTGVVRDMVQNHLLQIMALCAMEPPVKFTAQEIRDEKVKVFRSLRPIEGVDVERNVVFGQYEGYRNEPGVSPDSRTPTFVALRLELDNWRWQGVPFYLRAGKSLRKKVTEIAVHFSSVPLCLFGRDDVCQRLEPNVLTLRIQPDEGIGLQMACKVPGDDLAVGTVSMDFSYETAFRKQAGEAYERLLLDAMRGDATLFARRDEVEEAWKLITPVLDAQESADGPTVHPYAPGSSGPVEADSLLRRYGHRWRPLQ